MIFFRANPSKNQGFKHNESGAVIIWIFAMIGLFAALGYAINQGTRGGTQNISNQQADLAATEIIDYATAIKNAVRELQINGCSDTEISFENKIVTGYINPNAPSDQGCHVFHPSGGGLLDLSKDIGNTQYMSNYLNDSVGGYIAYTGTNKILNVGSSDHELIFALRAEKAFNVCDKLNSNLGIDTSPSSLFNLQVPFNGIYGVDDNTGTHAELDGKSEGCFLLSDGWIYYKVLITR